MSIFLNTMYKVTILRKLMGSILLTWTFLYPAFIKSDHKQRIYCIKGILIRNALSISSWKVLKGFTELWTREYQI